MTRRGGRPEELADHDNRMGERFARFMEILTRRWPCRSAMGAGAGGVAPGEWSGGNPRNRPVVRALATNWLAVRPNPSRTAATLQLSKGFQSSSSSKAASSEPHPDQSKLRDHCWQSTKSWHLT